MAWPWRVLRWLLSAHRWACLYIAWRCVRIAVRRWREPDMVRLYSRVAFGHLREFVTLEHKDQEV